MKQLSPMEIWMVKSNLQTIANGTPAEEQCKLLRHNGYPSIAEGVEEALKQPGILDPMRPTVLRICLNEDGTFLAFPWIGTPDEGDYANESLTPLQALSLMTSGKVPVEVATSDPFDDQPHNYETLTPKTVTLDRI